MYLPVTKMMYGKKDKIAVTLKGFQNEDTKNTGFGTYRFDNSKSKNWK